MTPEHTTPEHTTRERTEAAPQDVVAIIVAAGSSSRMGADKIWAPLAGRPVLAHSVHAFAAVPSVSDIVVVTPAERHIEVRALLPGEAAVTLHAVEGGARRQDSVAAGIAAAPGAGWYLVHDGARPLVTPALVARVLAAAREVGAAVPGVPVVDTVKRVEDGGAEGGAERVQATVDRATLRAVQTPQAFRADLLRRAHGMPGSGDGGAGGDSPGGLGVPFDATDDASMVEALGEPVAVVAGDRENIKITTPPDLAVAEALLALRDAGAREQVR
ncbi:MAG: 2-C-methyl-D-erythritol 4-phosphate cytidylyltransferase [Dehalococcoidia bacterium]|nr:2-C-methyl-D-erythritol 4-phosphate cytidylyltransferase [Dehalococcoidia bacterium]